MRLAKLLSTTPDAVRDRASVRDSGIIDIRHTCGKAPVPARVPTDARAQPDSTRERCPPAHPPTSDTAKRLPEKMFRGAWNQTSLSTPVRSATPAAVPRDSTGLCADCLRAREENSALATNRADGKIRNCRSTAECAFLCPIDWSPRPRNLHTPRHRSPSRSLDTSPPPKARTSGHRFVQLKRPSRQDLPPAHSKGEFFLRPESLGYASRAAHHLKQKPPGARVQRGGQLVPQPHAVPI
jgi:hypothetical protein